MPFNFLNQGQNEDSATSFRPIDTFIDPVSKIRVSNPANLIDTDFEYGLQPTKWETVEIINNTPAFFSKSGDTTIPDITGVTTNGGTREITVTTAFPHALDVGIPIRVSGTKSVTADGSYIINATPTPTTFTYLARANQIETISIFDLYTSIITGEFFQGSQISIADAEGMTTDGQGPFSTITIKTRNKHGFGPNTPFYFLNMNSTVSQEFESQNSTSLSFDPTNSATAQSFDGSNTLLQKPVDLSNSATSSTVQHQISSTDPANGTITLSLNSSEQSLWENVNLGDPLYYDVNIGSGYFQANPRGVVFIKEVNNVDANQLTATFQVSENPDGDPLPVLANMTGFFQIADRARTFSGNNINTESQIGISIIQDDFVNFDGGNQGYVGTEPELGQASSATVVGYTTNDITIFTAEGSLSFYPGAMILYSTDGTPATGLSNNTTYFVETFTPGASAGLFTMTIEEYPGQGALTVSGGSGTQTFSQIGVSIDKDVVHARNAGWEQGDLLEYSYPTDGRFGTFPEFQKDFYFVAEAFDTSNFRLQATAYSPHSATGGTVSTISMDGVEYTVHTFTSNGTFTVTGSGSEADIDYLIIGGGGPGAGGLGAGGGAGGMIDSTTDSQLNRIALAAGDYPVVVGNGGVGVLGGSGQRSPGVGSNGQNSSFANLVALGGGAAGQHREIRATGLAGGSGGGGGSGNNGSRSGGAGLQPTSNSGGYGNAGGNGPPNGNNYPGGGGGGAYEAGQSPADNREQGGRGGRGMPSQIDGNLYFYAGGGGGCEYDEYYNAGSGGLGGGGGGSTRSGNVGSYGGLSRNNPEPGRRGSNQRGGDAAANTGGGGGGATWDDARGGSGGSGIVIIRYPNQQPAAPVPMDATGGNAINDYTIDGREHRIHAFTSTGTQNFTVNHPGNIGEISYLIVGGGGGGGHNNAGGGGAGAVVTGGFASLSAGNYPVTVGGGASDGPRNPGSKRGGDSSAFGFTALGGGNGGGDDYFGARGGCGGGGADDPNRGGPGETIQISTYGYGQGSRGGDARQGGNGSGGAGGGGAGDGGQFTRSPYNRDGGRGVYLGDMFTTNYGQNGWFAGGGGGASKNSNGVAGQGGLGGGGYGANSAQSGTANTGGGGGGSRRSSGGNGGSGVVLIKYPLEPRYTS